jgi:hypothetical protein
MPATDRQNAWVRAPVWGRWRRLTKLFGSVRIAFAYHSDFLAGVDHSRELRIELGDGPSNYRTGVGDHMGRMRDTSDLNAIFLLAYYGLMEDHCRLVKWVVEHEAFHILERPIADDVLASFEALKLSGGIEAWAGDLMSKTGQPWSSVRGGLSGLVEVSIVRNLLAHGRARMIAGDAKKAKKRGVSLPFDVGSDIAIDYRILNEYRGRLRQFCRTLSDGVVHLGRGTHRALPARRPRAR